MSGELSKTVCVIGAGALGLVATKNMLEEGFEVATFERNAYVGGLWHPNDDVTRTSVHPDTKANLSKQSSCFTDFPYPDHASLHPTAEQQDDYLKAYAKHFNLKRHIHLSTEVVHIRRNEFGRQWVVVTKPTNDPDAAAVVQTFSRLIIASGSNSKRKMPELRGNSRFVGSILHSQELKQPSLYRDKTVVVVGTSSAAADTIRFLKDAGAKKIYISHKRAPNIIPLTFRGKSAEQFFTRRLLLHSALIKSISPSWSVHVQAKLMLALRDAAWPGLKDHPAFGVTRPVPSNTSSVPTMSDTLAADLLDGTAESVQRIERISDVNSIRLIDGTEVTGIDAIMCCTGDDFDTSSMVPSAFDPTNPDLAPDGFKALKTTPSQRAANPVPRLYRNFLSLQEPHSLAFLGHCLYLRGAFPLYDLITMALAQLWSGKFPMPSPRETERNADQHYRHIVAELHKGDVNHRGLTQDVEFDIWLQRVAGTGLYERLGGWGWQAWKFWWCERELYLMLMDGVDSPLALRLLETGRGRKRWEGARGALENANRQVEELGRLWEVEHGAGANGGGAGSRAVNDDTAR